MFGDQHKIWMNLAPKNINDGSMPFHNTLFCFIAVVFEDKGLNNPKKRHSRLLHVYWVSNKVHNAYEEFQSY